MIDALTPKQRTQRVIQAVKKTHLKLCMFFSILFLFFWFFHRNQVTQSTQQQKNRKDSGVYRKDNYSETVQSQRSLPSSVYGAIKQRKQLKKQLFCSRVI